MPRRWKFWEGYTETVVKNLKKISSLSKNNIEAGNLNFNFPALVLKRAGLCSDRRYLNLSLSVNKWNYRHIVDPDRDPSVGTSDEMLAVPAGYILAFFQRYDGADGEVPPALTGMLVTMNRGMALGKLANESVGGLVVKVTTAWGDLRLYDIAESLNWQEWGYSSDDNNGARYIHYHKLSDLMKINVPLNLRNIQPLNSHAYAGTLPPKITTNPPIWINRERPRRFYTRECEQIGTTTTWIVKTSEGKFKVWDTDLNIFLTEELEDNPWRNMAKHIGLRIKPRVDADNGDGEVLNTDKNVANPGISTKKLFDPGYTLKEVKFADADSHGDGEVPAFLIFQKEGQVDKKIVYKPRNLDVDQALFNTDDSVAKWLSDLTDNNTEIGQYILLSLTDTRGATGNGERYGYMEFVTSGVPTTEVEFFSVWKSLGANMAFSYIVGLEDIHHENYILKNDRIQLIDMEATTGMYTTLNDMQWGGLIMGRPGIACLEDRLKFAVGAKAYDWLPKYVDNALLNEITLSRTKRDAVKAAKDGFKDVLEAAKKDAFNASFTRAKNALSGMIARLVPIPTADFYQATIPVLGFNTAQDWSGSDSIDGQAIQLAGLPVGTTLVSLTPAKREKVAFYKRILGLESTYDAFVNLDVPAFKRHLGSNHIYPGNVNPDLGNLATGAIDSTGCAKVGRDIRVEMDERRNHLRNPTTNLLPEHAAADANDIEKTVPFEDFMDFAKTNIEKAMLFIPEYNAATEEVIDQRKEGAKEAAKGGPARVRNLMELAQEVKREREERIEEARRLREEVVD